MKYLIKMLLVSTIVIVSGCQDILDILQPPTYFSTDYGHEEYLPLAVGNTWTYNYYYTYTSMEIGQPQTPSTTLLGYEKWYVSSVTKNADSNEVFSVLIFHKGTGSDSSMNMKKMIRTKFITFLEDSYLPRTGADERFGLNPNYKKGVGMIKKTWGYFSGGPGSRGQTLYSLELKEYTVK
jgi:hypothetical protein